MHKSKGFNLQWPIFGCSCWFSFLEWDKVKWKNQFLLHCTHRSFLAGLVKRSQTNLFVYFRNWQDEAIVVSWFLLPFCLIVSNFDFWNVLVCVCCEKICFDCWNQECYFRTWQHYITILYHLAASVMPCSILPNTADKTETWFSVDVRHFFFLDERNCAAPGTPQPEPFPESWIQHWLG